MKRKSVDVFESAFKALMKIDQDAEDGNDPLEINRRLQDWDHCFRRKLAFEHAHDLKELERLQRKEAELRVMVELDRKYPARASELKRPN